MIKQSTLKSRGDGKKEGRRLEAVEGWSGPYGHSRTVDGAGVRVQIRAIG